MRTIGALTMAAALALGAGGCGKKDEGSADKKAAAPKAAEPAMDKPKVDTPAKRDEPAAPAYSPEEAAKLVAAMESCEYDFKCDAYKPLVSFGAKVAPDLAELAADKSKPTKARGVAAKALSEIKDPAVGMALFEAAKAEEDFMLRGDLFAAAGASGSDEVLAAAGAYYLTDAGWKARIEVRKAIVPFGRKAFDWGVAEIAKAKPKFQVALADVITDTAEAGDLETLKTLTGQVKDEMAAHRFARRRVELGDAGAIDVLIAGLESKDEYVRSDAGNMLGSVVEQVPADKKDKVIELTRAAKAKDRGGLTSAGYDKILKKLGAQ